ncbi:MAG: HAD-IA family hydrolase [Candidatus Methylopumilus sp.]
MQNNYDLIIFDWDGTLANSTQLIVDAIRQGSADVGLPEPSQAAASGIIGLGFREAVYDLFGRIPDDLLAQLTARYTHYYGLGEDSIPLFDGVAETIAHLKAKSVPLAVATGKGRRGLNKALANSGIGHHFIATRCVDECQSKPHPQMILDLMDEVAASPERTLMIGDTSFDLQMAQNAKVASLAVTYGAHPVERLLAHAPLAHFDQFAHLSDWLKANV